MHWEWQRAVRAGGALPPFFALREQTKALVSFADDEIPASSRAPPTFRQPEREPVYFLPDWRANSGLSRRRLHSGQIAAPRGADTCVWPFAGGVVLNPSLSGDSRRQQLNLPGCVLMGSWGKVCASRFFFFLSFFFWIPNALLSLSHGNVHANLHFGLSSFECLLAFCFFSV